MYNSTFFKHLGTVVWYTLSRGNLMLTSGCRLCKDDIPVKTWIFLYTNRFLKTKESEKGALYEKRFLHSKNYNIHPVIELTI